jgi:hypothetical protein
MKGGVKTLNSPKPHAGELVAGVGARARGREPWPRCGAHARSTGAPCEAEGSGIHGHCRHHCGASLGGAWRPRPVWTISVTPSGVRVSSNRPARGWRKKNVWPQRIRAFIAFRLILSGQVTRGIFFRGKGKRLLEALVAAGVRVVVDHASRWVRRVRFELASRQSNTSCNTNVSVAKLPEDSS